MSADDRDAAPFLDAWAKDSRVAPRPDAMRSARAAMAAAVAESAAASNRPGGAYRWRSALLRRHPWATTAAGMVVAGGILVGVGWNAGPGSPLHPVQQYKEDATLALTGGRTGASLRLDYAEARLGNAAGGSDPSGNLSEAAALLNSARPQLPPNRDDPLWGRWQRDEDRLQGLAAGAAAPATSAPAAAAAAQQAPSQSGKAGAASSSGAGSVSGGGTSAPSSPSPSGATSQTASATPSASGGSETPSPSPSQPGSPSPSGSPTSSGGDGGGGSGHDGGSANRSGEASPSSSPSPSG